MSHIMIDLETFDTRASATIVSIGAVLFDNRCIKQSFYTVVNTQSCLQFNFSIGQDTLKFWEDQAKTNLEAAKVLFQAYDDNTPNVYTALHMFSDFCSKYDDLKVWGNGAAFDNVILSEAFKTVGIKVPWDFWNDRCYRTIKSVYKDVEADAFKGVQHNALDDAIHQANHLIKINQKYPGIIDNIGEDI